MLGDGDQELVVGEDGVLLDVAVAVDAVEAGRKPVGKGKVHRFVEVEAVVEAGMVGSREGDDKLIGSLIASDDADTVLLESAGAHQCNELKHEIRLLLEELGRGKLHRGLELLVIRARNAVPCFGIAPVMVVDAAIYEWGQRITELGKRGKGSPVGVVVLLVPCESREDHPDVDPGDGHTGDVGLDVAQQRAGEDGQIVEIPAVARVGILRVHLEIGEATTCKGVRPSVVIACRRETRLTLHLWSS